MIQQRYLFSVCDLSRQTNSLLSMQFVTVLLRKRQGSMYSNNALLFSMRPLDIQFHSCWLFQDYLLEEKKTLQDPLLEFFFSHEYILLHYFHTKTQGPFRILPTTACRYFTVIQYHSCTIPFILKHFLEGCASDMQYQYS